LYVHKKLHPLFLHNPLEVSNNIRSH